MPEGREYDIPAEGFFYDVPYYLMKKLMGFRQKRISPKKDFAKKYKDYGGRHQVVR